MKEIKNYLHLYLGCEIYYPPREEGAKADIMSISWQTFRYKLPEETKLMLRPLSDMTEEEKKELANLTKTGEGFSGSTWHQETPEAFRYLLNKGFDLFGLIDAGLALDKTKLEKSKL